MGFASILQHPWLISLATLVIAFLVAARLLGAFRTERDEAKAGIVLLCAMRWNEYSRLISEMLKDRGMQPAGADRVPGKDGIDLLFARGTARYLVQCRNGANQTVTASAVGQLHSLVQVNEADGAIIVSCAAAEPEAAKLARDRRIEIIAGPELWAHVKPWVAHDQRIDAETVAQVAKRQRLLASSLISLVAAVAAFTLVSLRAPEIAAPPAQPQAADVSKAPRPAAAQPQSSVPTLPDASLTEQQLASRRASAILEVRNLAPVTSATWSTRSTLQVGLRDAPGDDALAVVVEDICRSLLQYEELRYTRLQLDVPAGTQGQPAQVRWRQCR